MGFKESYPDFAAIEEHVRRAHLERSVAIAHTIVDIIEITGRGLKKFARILGAKRTGALPQWARPTRPRLPRRVSAEG